MGSLTQTLVQINASKDLSPITIVVLTIGVKGEMIANVLVRQMLANQYVSMFLLKKNIRRQSKYSYNLTTRIVETSSLSNLSKEGHQRGEESGEKLHRGRMLDAVSIGGFADSETLWCAVRMFVVANSFAQGEIGDSLGR